jgi:hypothetical protein
MKPSSGLGPHDTNRLDQVEILVDVNHLFFDNHMVLADGTVYVAPNVQINEKDVLKNPVTCKDDTPSGVHQWYEVFVNHVMGHRVYAHPLWCYKKDHGGHWGFTAGNDPADDLPQHMARPS